MNALLSIFGNRSSELNNPQWSISNPPDWVFESFGSTRADTGEIVGPQKALGVAAFWRGVNLLASGVAKSPCHTLKRIKPSGKERATKHWSYRLVHTKPNQYMTPYQFFLTRVANKLIYGNSYAYIFRGSTPAENELLPLSSTDTWPIRANGELYYLTRYGIEFDGETGATLRYKTDKLPARDVLHFKGLGYDGLCGYPALQIFAEELGLSIATRKHASHFFRNAAVPSVVFEHPGIGATALSEKAQVNIEESYQAKYGGIDKAHKVMVLREGMKATKLANTFEESQFDKLVANNIRQLASFLCIPGYKLGDTTRQGYASLEQTSQEYLDDGLDPHLVDIEQELSDKLLSDAEREAYLIEFDRASLVRVDHKTKIDSLLAELNGGGMQLDEYRAILNRPPAADGIGNVYRMPVNLTILKGTADGDIDDVNFKREVVKQFLADKVINDVIFNMLDGKGLLEDVNLKTFEPAAEPWLPVISDSGEPVAGGAKTGPDGEMVGGDMEEPIAEPMPKPDMAMSIEDDEAVGRQFAAVLEWASGKARADLKSAALTRRRFVRRVVGKQARRLGHAAAVAAKKPDTFLDWTHGESASNMRSEHEAEISEEFVASLAVLGVSGNDAARLAAQLCDAFRDSMASAAACKPTDLVDRVKRFSGIFEGAVAQAVAERLVS